MEGESIRIVENVIETASCICTKKKSREEQDVPSTAWMRSGSKKGEEAKEAGGGAAWKY